MPKQLSNNSKKKFQKGYKQEFFDPKNILTFRVKTKSKSRRLKPKLMLKQPLSYSKSTFKKSKNDFIAIKNGQITGNNFGVIST